jgi:hypothetical protein
MVGLEVFFDFFEEESQSVGAGEMVGPSPPFPFPFLYVHSFASVSIESLVGVFLQPPRVTSSVATSSSLIPSCRKSKRLVSISDTSIS